MADKIRTKDQLHQKELGVMAACAIRAEREAIQEKEVVIVLMGGTWFGFAQATVEVAKRNMEVTCQIKSNHRLHPKEFMKNILKDSLGGMCMVLEGKYPKVPALIIIGHRHNSKVTSFFAIANLNKKE